MAVTSILVSLACFVIFLRLLDNRKRSRRPPGPRGWAILGNALQIPKDKQWLKFVEWQKEYGDLVQIMVFSQLEPTLILGSVEAAYDVLDTRGAMYSDRPPAVMAADLVGWGRGLGYTPGPPNPRFREFRRLMHKFIGPRASRSEEVSSMIEQGARDLVVRLAEADNYEEYVECTKQSAGSLILRLTYGYKATTRDDPLVAIADVAMDGFSKATEPGWLVDSFPVLRHMPSWFPGAGFKRVARAMRADLDALYDVPFDFVQKQMREGKVAASFVSSFIEEKNGNTAKEEEDFIKVAAGSLYSAGLETTTSAVASLILAMTLYPEVQRRAQTELDAVLGPIDEAGENPRTKRHYRLPTLADRERLPYTNAIVLEVWRWNPSAPLGLPHFSTQDNEYRGYTIEKGTVVWANIWSMLHDPTVFPEPSLFRPERFLDETEMRLRELDRREDPVGIAFGFGRRICPGLQFGEAAVFLNIATVLRVLNISKMRDEGGVEIEPEVAYEGFISVPKPFKCKIERRFPLEF
ncbi:hypothetical protein PLICRDRAFT_173216 [Plicaturopsis crispa FD-325 SS-3]|nr:hypothetical protein PLICRDRAFT_173216 [Plicaturopsis crispa FD-325 SS-3]